MAQRVIVETKSEAMKRIHDKLFWQLVAPALLLLFLWMTFSDFVLKMNFSFEYLAWSYIVIQPLWIIIAFIIYFKFMKKKTSK